MTRERERVQLDCAGDPGKTKQSHRDECDINLMMKRYAAGGQLPPPTGDESYGDFSTVGSYASALNSVMAAERNFNLLDAQLRFRFKNDPAQLIEFINDDANEDEARELGLLPKLTKEQIAARAAPPETAEAPTTESPTPAGEGE